MQFSFDPHRARQALVAVPAALVWFAGTAAGQAVDLSKPNDYYAVRHSGAVKSAESNHLGKCERNFGARDYVRAMRECAFILDLFPNHPQALFLMAKTCDRWKSPTCVLEDVFERAVSINPRAPDTYVIIGIAAHNGAKYAKAIESYEHALKLDPDLMNAHYNLALTYVETKQYDLANTHAQRAYALGAPLPGLRTRLEKAGKWKEEDAEARPKARGLPSQPAVAAPAK